MELLFSILIIFLLFMYIIHKLIGGFFNWLIPTNNTTDINEDETISFTVTDKPKSRVMSVSDKDVG